MANFLRNYWYVAARSEEIGRSLMRRVILNEPIVFYRTEAGEAVAMEDRCCHRSVPLSIGKLVADTVQCGPGSFAGVLHQGGIEAFSDRFAGRCRHECLRDQARWTSTRQIAAGSACIHRIFRVAVSPPKMPATSTQARKNTFTLKPAAPPRQRPQTSPAARKPL